MDIDTGITHERTSAASNPRSHPERSRRAGEGQSWALVIVRAQSVIWSDGSFGCTEPGMMYTQILVNGYWVVIEAAGQKYDFRAGSAGNFRLCPGGQGKPPSPPAAY